MASDEPIFDWLNPPQAITPLRLPLHDAELISMISGSSGRTLEMEVDAGPVGYIGRADKDCYLRFWFQGIESVRVSTLSAWPYELLDQAEEPPEKSGRIVQDCQQKWREESFGWSDFEKAFADHVLLVNSAALLHQENEVTLKIAGWLNGETYWDQHFTLYIRAESLNLTYGESTSLDFEEWLSWELEG